MKTVNITEDFQDDNFVFTMISSISIPFIRSDGTSLNGSIGYFKSNIKGIDDGMSVATFNIDIPIDAIDPTITIDYALSCEPYWDYAFVMINNSYEENIIESPTNELVVGSLTRPMVTGSNSVSLVYVKDDANNQGLDEFQVSKMQVTYKIEGDEIVQSPIVTSITADRYTIGNEPAVNRSIIKVRFDRDITNYVARLNGTDHTTGVIVHEGGSVNIGVDAEVIIDWNELTSEGSNRINIYGKGMDGSWTTYIPDN